MMEAQPVEPLSSTPGETRGRGRFVGLPRHTRAMKLLLIEDNPSMQATLQRSFERRGISVTTCADGLRALDRWRAVLPDVVLLDLSLPGRDGLQVLADARADGRVKLAIVMHLLGVDKEGAEAALAKGDGVIRRVVGGDPPPIPQP